MKVFYSGSAMWREWRMTGLLRQTMQECRPQKRWIDTVKEYLRKGGLDFRQAKRMVRDKSESQGFVGVNAWGIAQG